MRVEIDVSANMITWAIARAGFELHDFIAKFPRVQDWLDKTKKPTVKQLESFSHSVHLPFGYMFLQTPPEEQLPIPFFRTHGSQNNVGVSVNVFDTISILQQRQDWLKDYLLDSGYNKLPFVGKYNVNANALAIVADIRATLNLNDDWASRFATWQDALNHLTQKIEDCGVVIVFNGVVENNTSRPISVQDCRGFVLVDALAPFMFINNSDGKAAQLFTIVHELAHIWIGQSAGFDFKEMLPANDPMELLCDRVAAEFLVPETLFNSVWSRTPNIVTVARYFKVSQIVIARRALDTGKITKPQFFAFYNDYVNGEFVNKQRQTSGGNFYATARKRIGVVFATHINNAVKANKLLYRDAYKLTGLQGDTYQTFFTKHL